MVAGGGGGAAGRPVVEQARPSQAGSRRAWPSGCGWATGGRRSSRRSGPSRTPTARIHRAEARTMAVLPRSAPAPRMLWSLDRDGWVALALEDVDGAHPSPALAARRELARVLAMVAGLTAALTPAPPGPPTFAERLQDTFVGWRRPGRGPHRRRRGPGRAGPVGGPPPAAAGRPGGRLAGGRPGPDLLHRRPAGRQPAADPDPGGRHRAWPWACRAGLGRPALLLPSVAMPGRPRPGADLRRHPVAVGVDPEAVTTTLAAVAGFLVGASRLPTRPARPAHPPVLPARPRPGRPWSGCGAGPAGAEARGLGSGSGLDEGRPLLQPVPAPQRLTQVC